MSKAFCNETFIKMCFKTAQKKRDKDKDIKKRVTDRLWFPKGSFCTVGVEDSGLLGF